jgi:hypothetical protein
VEQARYASLTEWPLDHPFALSLALSVIALTIAVALHLILQEKWATVGVSILISVLVAVPLTHLFALYRERDHERSATRNTRVVTHR